MATATEHLAEYDDLISQHLNAFFDASIQQAVLISPRYELLWRELSRVTLNGGKRLRPQMLMLAYEAFGGTRPDTVIPIAAALEVLHSSLLIHDDIIDREHTRRGELNISGVYAEKHYTHVADQPLRDHFADSTALLGGDLLQFATMELIDQADVTPAIHRRVRSLIYQTVLEVAGGQLLDSEVAFMDELSGNALSIARYKTASYSFVAPLMCGAILAGREASELGQLKAFATNLGIAFQLHDDLLGVFGDERITGKSTLSDLREGKRTYLVEMFKKQASSADVAAFEVLFGNPELNEADAQTLRSLLTNSGAADECRLAISAHETEARNALRNLPINQKYREKFNTFITKLTNRTL